MAQLTINWSLERTPSLVVRRRIVGGAEARKRRCELSFCWLFHRSWTFGFPSTQWDAVRRGNTHEGDRSRRHHRRGPPRPAGSAVAPGVAGRVRLIILVEEDEPSEQERLHAANRSGAFDFLNAPEEDRYTLRDGKPFDDGR